MIVAGQATRAANVETSADTSLTGDSRHINRPETVLILSDQNENNSQTQNDERSL
jgi:hypothetical protein